MSQIRLERLVSGALTDADSVVLEDATEAWGIKRNDTGAVEVAAGTAVTHVSTGVYVYDTSLLDPTVAHTASWKITTTDWGVDYVVELILPQAAGLCTLADIEREVALRVGPYERRTVTVGESDVDTPTAKTFVVRKMKSTVDLGGLEDRYVLRRGIMSSTGAAIPGFDDDDRVRLIDTYSAADGLLTIDRDYVNNVIDGEDIEIHFLEPDTELRPLVLATLEQSCKIADTTTVRLPNALAQQDITALCPWIQQVNQVWEISSAFSGDFFAPWLVNWWTVNIRDGHVWATLGPVPYPNSVLIEHWRYASTLVNGAYSVDGPLSDSDILHVNKNYAASKAHEMAFLYGNVRPRIMEAAKTGLYINQSMAVEKAEADSYRYFRAKHRRNMNPAPGLDASVWINGPTLAN